MLEDLFSRYHPYMKNWRPHANHGGRIDLSFVDQALEQLLEVAVAGL
jgi:hypothetical protein